MQLPRQVRMGEVLRASLEHAPRQRWVDDIRSRTADGEYFFCAIRFVFVATR